MSHSLDRLRRRRELSEDGFTLLEVIVAITVLALAAVGVVPLLLASIKSSYHAKLYTQSKQLTQERIDKMRNLPFHVDAVNGPFRDVLDTYFPNATTAAAAPSGTATIYNVNAGYVSASGARVAGEPTGAFYRYIAPADASFPLFRQVVDTQFLDKDLNAVTPLSTYDSTSTTGADTGWTRLLGVTVFSAWKVGTQSKVYRNFTQISDAKPATPVISSSARSTAISVSGITSDDVRTNVVAGYFDASGSVSTGSVASVKGLGAFIDRFPGTRLTGASVLLDAPPDTSSAQSANDNGQDLSGGSCAVACVGHSSVSGATAVVNGGLPLVGSSSAPVVATTVVNGGNAGFKVSMGANNPAQQLQSGPAVWLRDPGSAASGLGTASGYLSATAGSTHNVRSNASASGQVVEVLPTQFTPSGRGVVEITLTSSSLTCNATGTAGGATVTGTYSATVSYWDGLQNRYVALGTVQNGNSSDPLPAPSSLTVYSNNGTVLRLSDYIASWSSLLSPTTSLDSTSGRYANGTLDGIVTLVTTDLRVGDTDSALQVKVGALSCNAEDQR